MLDIIYVAAMGFLDRIRGDKFLGNKTLKTLLYAWTVTALLGISFTYMTIPFILAFWLGASIGWGEPYGATIDGRKMRHDRYEWWQVGPIKRSVRLAIIVRGLLWGLPISVLGVLAANPMIILAGVAYILAFPIALFTTRDWEKSEWVRGWIAGAFLLVVGL